MATSSKKQKDDKNSYKETTIDRSLKERLMDPLSSRPTSEWRENRPSTRSSESFSNEYWGRSRGDDLYRPSYSRERRMSSPKRRLSKDHREEPYTNYRQDRNDTYSSPRERSFSPSKTRQYDPETNTITRHVPPRRRSRSPPRTRHENPIVPR
ncbi:hypothetical protein CLU79DRAFT_761268, partial [Phycomyces nitens]